MTCKTDIVTIVTRTLSPRAGSAAFALALAASLFFGPAAATAQVLGGGTVDTGCMLDLYEEFGQGGGLNCTANDIQVAQVVDLFILDDGCAFPGDTVTFGFTAEVVLTAQERHDIGVYFATDGDPNGDGALTGSCSVTALPYSGNFDQPQPGGGTLVQSFVDLDMTNDDTKNPDDFGYCADGTGTFELDSFGFPVPCNESGGVPAGDCSAGFTCQEFGAGIPGGSPIQDTCGDIDDTFKDPAPGIFVGVPSLSAVCLDTDGDGLLNLPNCTSWRQPGVNDLCLTPQGAFPGAPSKCRCDVGFNIPIDIPGAISAVDKVTLDANGDPLPGDPTLFDFDLTGSDGDLPLMFQLDDDDPPFGPIGLDATFCRGNNTCANAPAMACTVDADCPSYSLTETVPSGWSLVSAECVSSLGTQDLIASGGVLTVAPAEELICTFVNQLAGTPALDLVKSLQSNADEDGSGDVTVGDTLTYEFVATNTGDQTLTNVTIVDPLPGLSALSCTPSQPSTLAPGESMTCTATYVVTQADADAGVINNTATADSDETGPEMDSETVPVNTAPALALDKSLQSNADEDGSGGVTVGDTLTYQFVATNTGDQTLTNVTITDPLPGLSALSCTPTQPSTLAPGESMTCTATYVVTQADADAGVINNTATADSDETDPVTDPETVPVAQNPALALDKSLLSNADADGSGDVTVGDTLTYQFVATNVGDQTLSGVTITDPLPGLSALTCTPMQPSTLAPGDSMTCTATYVVTQADADAGVINNTATADSNETGPETDSETVPVTQNPALALDKSFLSNADDDGSGDVTVGDTLTYQFVATNVGDVTLTNVTIADPLPGLSALACTPTQPSTLAPGESMTCTATYVVTQADADAGVINNTATADSNETGPETDSETVPVNTNAALALDKSLLSNADDDGSGDVTAGDTLTYQFVATNVGDVTLTGVTITDPLPGLSALSCSPGQPSTLAPGESMTCTATYVVTQADADAGVINNTATADSNETGPEMDSETVPITADAALSLDKSLLSNADEDGSGSVTLNDTLTYQFVATNTGEATSTSVTIVDPLPGLSALTCSPNQPATLAPGESMTCTATYVVNQADVDNGQIDNTATADSDQTGPVTDPETVPTAFVPLIDLVKDGTLNPGADGEATPGDVIDYTFQVTNVGNVTLFNVAVTDPLVPAITCPGGNPIPVLAVGASQTCTGSYAITQADIDAGARDNTADATGFDPDGSPVSDQDSHSEPLEVAPPANPCTGEAFIVQNVNAQLTQIDQSASPFTFIDIGIPAGVEYNNMGFRSTDGLLYAVQLNSGGNTQIIRVDRDGVVSGLGRPAGLPTGPRFDAGDVSTDGTTMYITTANQSLYLLDLTSVPTLPPVTEVPITGSTGFVFDWAYRASDGLLYGGDSTHGDLAILNPLTGVRTDVNLGALPAGTAYGGAWFNAAGELFLYRNNGEIYEIDLSIPDVVGFQFGPGSSRNDGASCIQNVIGAAKQMTATSDGLPETLTIDYVIENFSMEDLFNLSATDDLAAVFGTHGVDWTFTSISSSPAAFANPSFDGHTDTDLVNRTPTQTLLAGATATVTVVIEILTLDNLNVDGEFCNQVFVLAETADGTEFGDLSTQGTDPDPDGNGSPDERELACEGFVTPQFDLDLVKTLQSNADEDGSGTVTEGDTLTYAFVATNAGTSPLTGVTISDPLPGLSALSCTPSQPASLAPGASLSCTATYPVTAADATAGQIVNTATASSNEAPDDQDSETVPVEQPASLDLVKSLLSNADEDGSGTVTENDTLTYQFVATNTGAANLTNVTISDPLPGLSVLSCTPPQPATLAPGASLSCTATYVVTAADVTAGQIVNTATASSDQAPDDMDTETVPTESPQPASMTLVKNGVLDVGSAPGAIQLVKTGSLDPGADGQSTPGDLITYSFAVTNPGPSPLTNVTVSDPLVPAVSCPSGAPGTPDVIPALAVGVTETCTGSYAITQADVDAGVRDNTATVSGLDSGGNPVGDSDSHSEPIPAGGFECTGEAFIIQNIDAELTQIDQSVSPFVFIPVTGPLGTEINNLGFRITDGLMYGVQLSAGGNVQIVSIDPTGTVTGLGRPAGLPTSPRFDAGDVSADGTTMYINAVNQPLYVLNLSGAPLLPPVSVVNVTGATGFVFDWAASPIDGLLYGGDSTSGQLAILNPATGVRTDVNLTDTGLGTLPSGTAFGGAWFNTAGELFLYRNNGQIYTIDLSVPTIVNVQTGLGSTRNDGAACIPPGTFDPIEGKAAAGLDAAKSHLPGIADPGDLIHYTFEVTNTGSVTLTNVLISDPLVPVITCPSGNPIPGLAPAASQTCTGSYAITQADIDAGVVDNTATADSDQAGPVQGSDSEPIPQTLGLDLDKTGALDQGADSQSTPGDLIDYTFQVTNTGNVTLTNVAVTDPLVAAISCPSGNPIPSLAPAASQTCTGSYAIVQADIDAGVRDNTATADSDQAGPVQDSHSEPIPGGSTFACTGDAFIVQNVNASLTRVDQSVSPFVFVPVGVPTGSELNNLGFRITDGLMYAVELNSGGNTQIVQIDATGNVIGLGRPAGLPSNLRFDAGDVSPDGTTMYINTVNRPLYVLDLTLVPGLPAVTQVNITGAAGFVFDWAASPIDGLLYGGDSTDSQLAILDPVTGVRTDVAVEGCTPFTADCAATGLPADTAYGGAWFDNTGTLFLYRNTGAIYEIDLDGGGPGVPRVVRTQTGPSSTRNDGAACIPPAP
jgi:uncharacterized repeat protein (TIGR01451 family)